MKNIPIITDYIVDCLVNEWNDYPEKILDDYNINYEGWSDEEIDKKSNEILDEYIILDDKEEYTDLEKSYQDRTLYFKYDNTMYGIGYTDSCYRGVEIYGELFKVQQITKTVTINEYIRL